MQTLRLALSTLLIRSQCWHFQKHQNTCHECSRLTLLLTIELRITSLLTLPDYCRSTQPEWNASSFFTYSTYKQQWSRYDYILFARSQPRLPAVHRNGSEMGYCMHPQCVSTQSTDMSSLLQSWFCGSSPAGAMIGENRQLVTNEPVGFEKYSLPSINVNPPLGVNQS